MPPRPAPRPARAPPHPANRSPAQSGDKVVYSKYAGTEIELQGDNYVLLKVRRLPGGGTFQTGGAAGGPVGGSAPRPRTSAAARTSCSSVAGSKIHAMSGVAAAAHALRRRWRAPAATCCCPLLPSPSSAACWPADWAAVLLCLLQEDDVIGLLSGDDIAKLQPLQVRARSGCRRYCWCCAGRCPAAGPPSSAAPSPCCCPPPLLRLSPLLASPPAPPAPRTAC